MKYDFPELKRRADILSTVSNYVSLKKDGANWVGCCPFHDEKTSSFVVSVSKGIFKCFGCGKAGDALDFLQAQGFTLEEINEMIMGDRFLPSKVQKVKKTIAAKKWAQAVPTSPCSDFTHYRLGLPVKVWAWLDASGKVFAYDCRFEREEEGRVTKQVLPLTYATDGTYSEWRWMGMQDSRPLANLPKILKDSDRSIMIVEGRKTMEAAEQLLSKPILTTWQGGGHAVKQTDWSPLYGKKIIIWQDNDHPGYMTACEIAEILKPHCDTIKFVHNPEEAQKGWDAADALAEGWDAERARKYVNSNIHAEPQVKFNDKAQESHVDPYEIEAPSHVKKQHKEPAASLPDRPLNPDVINTESQPPTEPQDDNDTGILCAHFRFLGFVNKDGKLTYCFYCNRSRTVVRLSTSSMGKGANLIDIAPLEFWQENFPGKAGFDLAGAVNWLVGTSQAIGMFSVSKIRGRGAWIEGERFVYHSGDIVYVDGRRFTLNEYRSKYIYEVGNPLGIDLSNPLPREQANVFLQMSKRLKWERDINAYLFAGWCVIAPICGLLKWRPHVWITGGSGSGKSWILKNILKAVIMNTGIYVQGATSEAGLRQSLIQDALAVVYDEAESEDRSDQERFQKILNLARSSSSEDGGNIIKGTVSSGADVYSIRSCFAFASIGMQVSMQSDKSRITPLSLVAYAQTPEGEIERISHFDELKKFMREKFPEDFGTRFQARTIRMLPTLLKNIKTFSDAAASMLGQQRMGDQLGAMMAGAYSLVSDGEIDYEKAKEWIKDKDWSEEYALKEHKDERDLLQFLLEQTIKIEGAHTTWDRSIGEAIDVVLGRDVDGHIAKGSCEMSLLRCGIKIKDGKMVAISNSSNYIKKALRETSWSKNHSTILLRIPFAVKLESERFGSSLSSRAVGVPISYID